MTFTASLTVEDFSQKLPAFALSFMSPGHTPLRTAQATSSAEAYALWGDVLPERWVKFLSAAVERPEVAFIRTESLMDDYIILVQLESTPFEDMPRTLINLANVAFYEAGRELKVQLFTGIPTENTLTFYNGLGLFRWTGADRLQLTGHAEMSSLTSCAQLFLSRVLRETRVTSVRFNERAKPPVISSQEFLRRLTDPSWRPAEEPSQEPLACISHRCPILIYPNKVTRRDLADLDEILHETLGLCAYTMP